MKTPTHLAINYLILPRLGIDRRFHKAFLLGGVLPDVPICFLFVGVFLWQQDVATTVEVFRHLYETHAWVIAAHSVLHSPLSLLAMLVLSFLVGKYQARLEVFIAGCFCHSLVDIYTHVDDGPIVFWPFDWQQRFTGIVSHWDSNYGGNLVMLVEMTIMLMAVLVMVYKRNSRTVWLF